MSVPMMLDLAVLLILLIFFIRGFQLGFIRSFFSLLALFVAFLGALFLAKQLTPVLSDLAAPHILPSIVQKIEKDPSTSPSADLSSEELSHVLQKLGLPQSWLEVIEKATESQNQNSTATTNPSQFLARSILEMIASPIVFILCFVILLLLLNLLIKALDLVSKLPILNLTNRILGALFGLCKALLLLFLLHWLFVDLLGKIPADIIEQTKSFQIFSTLFPQAQFPSSLPEFYKRASSLFIKSS